MDQANIENQIDDIIRSCRNYRFATELHATQNEERKKILRQLLPIQKEHAQENTAREKFNKLCAEVDKCALKKSWNKLTIGQKQERLNEYFKRVDEMDKLEKVLKMLEDKKLKHAYVEYNSIEGFIKALFIPTKEQKVKK